MIVTQPRRISAIGVSERIANERCEKVGDTCGYSIKLEKKMSAKTRLLLCTTGVLLRRLQCDPDLAAISHIFVDEVHERSLGLGLVECEPHVLRPHVPVHREVRERHEQVRELVEDRPHDAARLGGRGGSL